MPSDTRVTSAANTGRQEEPRKGLAGWPRFKAKLSGWEAPRLETILASNQCQTSVSSANDAMTRAYNGGEGVRYKLEGMRLHAPSQFVVLKRLFALLFHFHVACRHMQPLPIACLAMG